MSVTTDHDGPEFGGDDAVAAEYVVGVLSGEERRQAQARVESDPAFARLVEAWEGRLFPLADAYAPVEPPAAMKAALDRRLFDVGERVASRRTSSRFWQNVALWRGFTAAALVALAIAIVVPSTRTPVPPAAQYMASLAASGSDVHYLAYYNERTGNISLSHVSGGHAQGRDFELWAIEGKNKPVPLGVIPSGESPSLTVNTDLREKLASGWLMAISVEPAGGSPTGQPTGPVVAAGDLRKI